MTDRHTCRMCGRVTSIDKYEWRDDALYRNLERLRLCEECYQNSRHRH
jgi:uncharacterized protein YlaI